MPTYPAIKTYRGGFYNNHVVNGQDDRVYTAEDVRKPYDTVFSDGVLPEADGTAGATLEVKATGGMGISVGTGHAKLGGAWFENERLYNITLDVGGDSTRYDCVIIRNDDTDNVREPSIYVNSLTAVPTISNLTRNDNIYEICVAYIRVPALATSISDADIVDTRADGLLCKIMSGVGATVVRTYRNTYFSVSENQTSIPIGISQFDRTKDELIVAIEGRVFTPGTNYTVASNTHITLAIGLPVIGTKIEFTVHKNVNSTTSADTSAEVGQLQTDVANLQKVTEHDYYCNGLTDNIEIGKIVRAFLSGGSGYASMKLNVHGTFGAYNPARGDGASGSTTYGWFDFFVSNTSRKAVVDFTDCSQILTPVDAGTYNVIFYGKQVHVIGANLIVDTTGTGTRIRAFSTDDGEIVAENCRFWITGYQDSYLAQTGTFINCRGSVTNLTGHSYCFPTTTNSLIRIIGGEYYAYTASSTSVSAVVGETSGADAVAILYAVSAPTTARSGYYQTHCLYQTNGLLSCTDIVTALEMSVVSGQSNISGTLAKSKPNML